MALKDTLAKMKFLHIVKGSILLFVSLGLVEADCSGGVKCGGKFTGDEGTITTPNYPNNYPTGCSCVWVITVSNSSHDVLLTYSDFDLGLYNLSCPSDYVKIRHGATTDQGTTVSFDKSLCGSRIATTNISDQHQMHIEFRSDGFETHKGFSASWRSYTTPAKTACGGNLTGPGGTFHSPNYPNHYISRQTCVWIITVSSPDRIVVSFNVFYLEFRKTCDWDRVEIRNGGSKSSPMLGQKLCGYGIPPAKTSDGNQLYIMFYADPYTNLPGFNASWTIYGAKLGEKCGTKCQPGLVCQGTCKLKLNSACDEDSKCMALASCNEGHCLCKPPYKQEGGQCKLKLNSACNEDSKCMARASCNEGHCLCKPPYEPEGGQCKSKLLGDCSSDEHCYDDMGCEKDKCKLKVLGNCSSDDTCLGYLICDLKTCKQKLNGNCSENQECRSTDVCDTILNQCKAYARGAVAAMNRNDGMIIGILVPVALLLLCLGACFARRRRKKPEQALKPGGPTDQAPSRASKKSIGDKASSVMSTSEASSSAVESTSRAD